MRFLLVSFLLIVSMVGLSCNRGGNQDSSSMRIALVLKTLNSPFFVDLRNGAQAAADSAGVKLIVQAPEREIDVEKQNINLMTINSHKIHGPKGVGALYIRKGTNIIPSILRYTASHPKKAAIKKYLIPSEQTARREK